MQPFGRSKSHIDSFGKDKDFSKGDKYVKKIFLEGYLMVMKPLETVIWRNFIMTSVQQQFPICWIKFVSSYQLLDSLSQGEYMVCERTESHQYVVFVPDCKMGEMRNNMCIAYNDVHYFYIIVGLRLIRKELY